MLQHVTIQPVIYALVGSASFLSGVTRMTVSLILILFELTNSLTYVVPLMLSTMVAKWVADGLERDSIHDLGIALCGYPYLDHKKTVVAQGDVSEVLETGDTLQIETLYTFDNLERKLADERMSHLNVYFLRNRSPETQR